MCLDELHWTLVHRRFRFAPFRSLRILNVNSKFRNYSEDFGIVLAVKVIKINKSFKNIVITNDSTDSEWLSNIIVVVSFVILLAIFVETNCFIYFYLTLETGLRFGVIDIADYKGLVESHALVVDKVFKFKFTGICPCF